MTLVDIEAPAEVRRDQWGRYKVLPPGGTKPVGYQRATTLAKMLEDSSSLTKWSARMALLGAAQRPDIIASVLAADPNDRKTLDRLAEQAKEHGGANVRRELGTALHKFVELSHADPSYTVPELYRADVEAINAAIDAAGFDVVTEFSERILVVDSIQVAGMCDLVLRRRSDGALFLADLKTGASVAYHLGWVVQLSIYAHADAIYVQGPAKDGSEDVRLPAPQVSRERGLVVHCEPGSASAALHWLVLGTEFLTMAVGVREVRKRRDLLVPFENVGGGTDSHTEQGTACPSAEPVVVGLVENPTTTAAAHNPRAEWLLARTTALVERLGKAHLAEAWPTDVARPAPVRAGEASWTDGDIDAVASALDALEARHDVPFGPDDPKVVAERRAELDAVIAAEAAALTKPKPEPDPHPEVETGPMAPVNGVRSLREILRELKGSTDADRQQRAVRIQHWQTQAAKAGVPWYTGQLADDAVPLRLFHIVDAAVELADLVDLGPKASDPDHRCRDLVAAVVGDQLVQQPTTALGAALGLLTVDQAKALAEAAHAAANSSR